MRRASAITVFGALLLAALSTTAVAQTESPGASGSPAPSGAMTVDVPAGAAPAGATVTVVAHPPSERPDELKGVPSTLAFYEIQPSDVTFSAPATVTRTVRFGEVGIGQYDPLFDGLIVGSLFTRAPDGTWSWLQNTTVGLDPAGSGFTITGTIDHGGPVFAFIPDGLVVANEDATSTPVGQSFRVEGQVRADPDSRADISAVAGTSSDESVAKVGDRYDVTFFDRAEGIEFQCLAPGTVQYGTTFTISDVADVGPLTTAVSLNGTDVSATQSGQHTCQ